jgi:hypothetical protein
MREDEYDRPSLMGRRAVKEMIALQRRIFERQRRLIESRESHENRGFTRYRNEYRRAVAGYIAESGFGALCDAIAASRVAYVADYHTLKLAQKTFVKIVRGVMHQVESICLAMEFVPAEHQQHLDRFIEGRVPARTFLKRIRYEKQWPYDIWPGFEPIFDLARERGFPVVAIDDDPGLPLAERDRRAAQRIAAAAMAYPDSTILVYAGQMHLAPSHLPAKVDLAFIQAGLPAPERVIVYQNAEEIYWQLAAEGREEVEVVKVAPDAWCVNNTPPLVQQLSYLHWIHFDSELIEYTELERTVRALVRDLARYLKFDLGAATEEVRVMMVADLELMDALEDSELTENEKRRFIRQVEAEESAYVPALNTIYLATLSVNHAAEEAAHYVKQVASGAREPGDHRDFFYYLVLNEACAFFGSKVVNPKRKADHEGKLRSMTAAARAKGEWGADEQAARLALEHLAWERGGKAGAGALKHAADLAEPDVFNAAVHLLGYIVGDKLYYGLTDGVIAKPLIRELFLDPLDAPGQAFSTYLSLVERLREVRIPRRI